LPVFRVSPPIGRGSRRVTVGNPRSAQYLDLGRLSELGPRRHVVLDISAEHVLAIVGKRGSGKTHTLGVVAEGVARPRDSAATIGAGPQDHAVLLLDTLNIFQWMHIPLDDAKGPVAEEQRQVLTSWGLKGMTICPTFWHVAGCEPTVADSRPFTLRPSDLGPQDWGLLLGADILTEPMGQLLVAAQEKVAVTGWRNGGGMVRPNPKFAISDLIACIQRDSPLALEFAPETRRAVRQRLAAFDRSGVFSLQGTRLPEMLKPGSLTILLLGRVPEDLRSLVAFLVIRRLLEERSAASEAAKDALIKGHTGETGIPKTWVMIDEAQNIMPARAASLANDVLTRFVREGRNFGLSMAISTQQPIAIDSRVMAQVDTLMAHTLTVRQDVAYVLANLKSADPSSIVLASRKQTMAEALRLLSVGQCLVSAVDSERTFFLAVRPRATLHGGFEA